MGSALGIRWSKEQFTVATLYSWADKNFSGKAIMYFYEPVISWYCLSPRPAGLLGLHWKEAVAPQQCDLRHWPAWGQSGHPEETKRESINTGMNMTTDNWMVYTFCKIIITWDRVSSGCVHHSYYSYTHTSSTMLKLKPFFQRLGKTGKRLCTHSSCMHSGNLHTTPLLIDVIYYRKFCKIFPMD